LSVGVLLLLLLLLLIYATDDQHGDASSRNFECNILTLLSCNAEHRAVAVAQIKVPRSARFASTPYLHQLLLQLAARSGRTMLVITSYE
jgi:hypothetical protein